MNPGVNLLLPAKVSDKVRCAKVLVIGSRKRRRYWEVEPQHVLNGSEMVARDIRGEFFRTAVELDGFRYLHLIEKHPAKRATDRQTTATFLEIEYLNEWRGADHLIGWHIVGAGYRDIPDGMSGRIQIERHTIPQEN